MKHMNSRRILAMLLALCMMVGMLSMTAFATDAETGSENSDATTVEVSSDTELKNAFKNATDGQTIKLTANITGKYLRTISKRVTIDLNGCTWEVTGNYCTLQLSGAGADVTVIDSAVGGVIKNSYSKSGGNSYVVDFISSTGSTAGTFTLKSGTIETTPNITSINSTAIGSSSDKTCTVNIEGGTILVPDAAKNGRGIVASNGMTLNVSGGEIIGGSYGIDLSTGASATIMGGTIRSKTVESTTINKAYAIRTVGTPSLTIGGGETAPEISGILIGGNTTSTDTPTIVLKDGNVGYFYNKTGTEFKVDASQLTSVTADETIQAFLPSGCTYNAETGEVTKEASEVYVAYIGTQGYTTLEEAFAALNETNHTLTLTAAGEAAWTYENVYWMAGEQTGSAATLKAAMTAAYAANANSITIICKPDAKIAMSNQHINVTGDITIYANGADFCHCDQQDGRNDDLSIGTSAAPVNGKATVNVYDAKNLTVWGQPVAGRTDEWTVNLVNCENNGHGMIMYRNEADFTSKIYVTLTGCKATGYSDSIVHTTADGSITITDCEFTNNCAPVNIAHKQNGEMTVTVKNTKFDTCGKVDPNNYFAPVRIVNNNETGTVNVSVDGCTFMDTVGVNGDILLGDGRPGKQSHNVSLTVKNTEATVMAQKPGYYGATGTVEDATLGKQQEVAKSEEVTTSVETLLPTAAEGVAKITRNGADVGTYATLAEALEKAQDGDTITLLSNCSGDGLMVAADRFANSGLTVDFGGHTYTFNGTPVGSAGSETQAAHFESGNKITLKNGKFNAAENSNVRILVQNYADLTLSKMELDGTNVAQNGTNLFTLSCNNGNVVIEDSTIKAPAKATGQNVYPYAVDICGFAKYDGVSVTVKGTSEINGDIRLASYDTEKARTLKLKLEGGKVSGNLYLGALLDVDRENTTVTKASSVEMTAPSGYMWDKNGTLVKNAAVVARYDGKDYTSLQEAVNVAAKDGTVTLIADTDENVTIDGKNLTLHFSRYFLNSISGPALTVKNATVTLRADNANGGINAVNGTDSGVAVLVGENANVAIWSGRYTGGTKNDGKGDYTIYVTSNGAVTLRGGGKFYPAASNDGEYYVLGKAADASGSITIKFSGVGLVNYNPLNDENVTLYGTIGFTASTETDKKTGAQYTVYTSVTSVSYQVLGADGKPVKAYKASELSLMLEKLEKDQTVRLLANATANITIPAGKDFTLDLNGKTLSNGKVLTNGTVKENAQDHTITVEAGAKLTIVDNVGGGTVDNITHGKAAIVNKGEVVLNGGTYTRSLENADNNKEDSKGNSYYTVVNYGTMTINDGVKVENVGHYSSMIRNGGVETNECCLTINGGTFDGGINTVKNDVMGALTINDGSFSNTTQFVVMNWNKTEIKGGTFAPTADAEAILFSAYIDKDCAVGKLTISGGMFTAQANTKLIEENYYNVDGSIAYTGTAAVSGGTFNKAVDQKFCADGYEPNKINDTEYGVKPAEGNVKLIGADGNVRYGNIADAADGETIQLYKDITVDGVFLRSNKTLDLNGHKLTTEYVYAPGADVIDSKDGVGKLVVTNKDNVTVKMSASYLPLYDGTGYRIFKYTFTFLDPELDSTKSKITLRMTLAFENLDAYNVLTASSQHGIDMGFRVAWPNDNNSDQSWQLRMTPEGVTDVYTKAKTKVGLEGCKTGKVKLVITGVNLLSSDVLYSLSELVSANWTNGMTIVSDKATTTIK